MKTHPYRSVTQLIIALIILLVSINVSAQDSTLQNLSLVSSPLDTDMIPTLPAGGIRLMKTTRGDLRLNLCPTTRTVTGVAPLSGGGALTSNLTIGMATQTANTFIMGPSSGGAAVPTGRIPVLADFPAGLLTYAKLQNISTNNRLLGRATAGAGSTEEITLGTGLSFTGTTLNASNAGSVTSVAITGPSFVTWSGTPITVSGTLTGTLANQAALSWFGNNTGSSAAPTFNLLSALSHNNLGNLTTGDAHTQYANINGRSGGQTINGGTASGDSLNLHGSTNATSGGVVVSGGDSVTFAGSNGQQWIQGQWTEFTTWNNPGFAFMQTVTNLPANSVIRAVVVRITSSITGTCGGNLTVGDPTTPARFITGLSTTGTSTAVGLLHVDQTGAAGPKQTAAARVQITCGSGTATGGQLRVTVYYDQFVAPTS